MLAAWLHMFMGGILTLCRKPFQTCHIDRLFGSLRSDDVIIGEILLAGVSAFYDCHGWKKPINRREPKRALSNLSFS